MVKLERHVVNGEALQWTQISFLAGFIKDLGLQRTIWKCDDEPSTKPPQGVMIQVFEEMRGAH